MKAPCTFILVISSAFYHQDGTGRYNLLRRNNRQFQIHYISNTGLIYYFGMIAKPYLYNILDRSLRLPNLTITPNYQ